MQKQNTERRTEDDEQAESSVIIKMLENAEEYGLQWEVMVLYLKRRKDGHTPHEAAYQATYEWDL